MLPKETKKNNNNKACTLHVLQELQLKGKDGRKGGRKEEWKEGREGGKAKQSKESAVCLPRAIIIKKSTAIQSTKKPSDVLKLHWSHFWSQNLK